MEWIINWTMGLFVTTMTGSIAILLWYLPGRLLVKCGLPEWYFGLLKIAAALFGIPVMFLVMKYLMNPHTRWGGVLFWPTEIIYKKVVVIWIIWLAGAVLTGIYFAGNSFFLYRKNKTGTACEPWEQACFDDICRQMGIREGRVRLYKNRRVAVPEISGLFHPKVMIPVAAMDGESLKVTLVHELTHYRHRDIFWKQMINLVCVIQYFNPLAWWLAAQYDKWSEYMCDAGACRILGDVKRYFNAIFAVAVQMERAGYFKIGLAKNRHTLVKRVDYMKKYSENQRKHVKTAVLVCLILAVICPASVFAASDGIAVKYKEMYLDTDVEIPAEEEEILSFDQVTEYTDQGPGADITVEEDETAMARASMIEWTVGGKTMKKTGAFSVKAGEKVVVTVLIDPADVTVKAGVIDPSGTRHYAKGSGYVGYSYEAETSGYHRVFVENTNSVQITASVSYAVQ